MGHLCTPAVCVGGGCVGGGGGGAQVMSVKSVCERVHIDQMGEG